MATKDIRTALANFEKGTMSNKGTPRIGLYPDMHRKSEVIPTGIPDVDKATNAGGLPRCGIVEIFGPESGGKSWISMKTGASAQRMGLRVALIDVEHSFDQEWARSSTGLNPDELLYGSNFDNGEMALQYVLGLCQKELADVIIVDSTAALVPKAELEANLEDSQMGVMARMMSRGIRQINDACFKSNTLVIFVNQLREKIGVMFGNPETTPGGRALKFYAFMRIRVGRIGKPGMGTDEDGIEVPVYIESKAQIVKNKIAAPFGESMFQIRFNASSDPFIRLVEKACELKVLRQRTDDDEKKVFIWGKGKTAEFTGCERIPQMAEWVVSSVKVAELVELVKAAAIEKGKEKDVAPELLALTDKLNRLRNKDASSSRLCDELALLTVMEYELGKFCTAMRSHITRKQSGFASGVKIPSHRAWIN